MRQQPTEIAVQAHAPTKALPAQTLSAKPLAENEVQESRSSPIPLADIRDRVPLHLEAVSRSFAFCIARLEPELREPIGLAYLLCRMLDTIEDTAWDSKLEQDAAYELFLSALHDPNRPFLSPAANWPWDKFREGERTLFRDFEALRELWWVQPAEVRLAIDDCVRSMQKGMRGFRDSLAPTSATSPTLELGSLGDVNRYCFFVAGIVGEMLTRVFRSEQEDFSPSAEDVWRFGLFLQKVNILKDQPTDEIEGRFLVPTRPGVLRSTLQDAESAWRYIQCIPSAWPGYQLFCAWSYFLGLETLVRLATQRHGEAGPVASRWETLEMIAEIENELAKPEAWRARREILMSRLRAAVSVVQTESGDEAWKSARVPWSKLAHAYQGQLSAHDLQALIEA
ncbi:MAG TPA: squalene/phytoene synthase family protein [Pseudobdellovibrionaceae bacterium]|nr:squalene/phytoene synthase family protein [Pseudobdellovibrionaceae bacterium]